MLMKAGYSAEEASRFSGHAIPLELANALTPGLTQREVAAINERKYAGVGMSAEERLCERIDAGRKRVYQTIRERHLIGCGDCKTEKGIIRRIKYGKGNLSKRGYLKAPINTI